MSRRLRVAAFGSPAFAVPTLEALHRDHDLRLVVTQRDKPAGRGMRPRAPEAAAWARERGLPLEQPTKLRDPAFAERLRSLDLDVAVTAAYGRILPKTLLEIPTHGFLNVHASLLPSYRGAAPIQRALIDGVRETGVTIMQTEEGLDTGPIRLVRRLAVGDGDDAASVSAALAALGAEAMAEALRLLADGRLPSDPQDDARATHAAMLTRDDGRVRWSDPTRAVLDRHRGVSVWPGSWTTVPGGDVLKVHAMRPADRPAGTETAAPGSVLGAAGRSLVVATGDGAVAVDEVQAPGRARVAAADWARGSRFGEGARLG